MLRDHKWDWHLRGVRREFFGRGPTVVALAAMFLATHACLANDAGYYTEPFRPQYHFTPEKNWMNDPNGLVYYEGEYHLFYQYNPFGDKWGHMSWGHAVGSDLVHWKHLALALPESDSVMIFSGSAVVNWKNTSGFGQNGKPPIVAIYTGYNTSNNLQYQCVAYSNDKGRTWTKYSGNPVININSKDFRDPKVHWYEPAKCWLMVVALSDQRKIRFYHSSDLKHWTSLSDFGPAGATDGAWECPDFFSLPVDGSADESEFVLVANVGGGAPAGQSGTQYFIGNFDGTNFTPDPDSLFKSVTDFVFAGHVLEAFEGDSFGGRQGTGTAFGGGLANSFHNGDGSTGTLTSPPFQITNSYIDFLIGGGSQKETCMKLLVDGKVVRTASSNEHLTWHSWDVSEFKTHEARLQIVDNATGGWEHVNVQKILLADVPARPAFQAALWLDYGSDLYATATWNDLPKADQRRILIGWINHWPDEIPGARWRGAMSIPREVSLRRTAEGVRLVQNPVREMKKLRQHHFEFKGGDMAQANAWLKKNHIEGNQLELVVEFDPSTKGIQGVKVLKGAGEETVIGVDRDRGTVFVDRTHSGNGGLNANSSRLQNALLATRNEKVNLHIFVDACSVEVFVNDGERVFTDLIFPSANSRGMEVFGPESGAKVHAFNVWHLKSILK